MALNDDDFVDESPFHRTDDFSSPNIVIVLKAREIGNVPVRHLKYAAEFKTALSILDEKTFNLPRGGRLNFLVALSDDCSRIASAYANNRIYVCNVNNGQVIRRLAGHQRPPWCLRFHPHYNDILVSGSINGDVRVWNIPDGSSRLWSAGDKIINAVAFHPSEQILVIACGNTLYFWNWNHPPHRAVYCSTRTEREKISYLTFDLYGRLIIGIVNDYHEKSKCTYCTSSCPGPSKDDKRMHEAAENFRKLFTSSLEGTFPPPPTSFSEDLPPPASFSGDLPPPASFSGDLPPPASFSGDLPPPASSSGELPPPVRFIREDETTYSTSSDNSSDSSDSAESNPVRVEVYVSTSAQSNFNWNLGEDGRRTPVTSRSQRPQRNTVMDAVEFLVDIHSPCHRIQCFNLSSKKLPAIHNETENVVAGNCTILNESSVDVSSDGQKLVVLISERDFKIGVFSLIKGSLGNLLCTWDNFSNALSVSFSPLGNLVVVGTTYADHLLEHPTTNPFGHLIKISCVNGQYNARRIRKFFRSRSNAHLNYFNLYGIKWLTSPGLGLMYCTSSGAFTIWNPVGSRNSPEMISSPPRDLYEEDSDENTYE